MPSQLLDEFKLHKKFKSHEGRCLVNLMTKRLCDASPMGVGKSFSQGKPENLGYIVLGPLLVGFCQWLVNRANTYNIPQLHFLSRDARICLDTWQLLYPNNIQIEVQYLLTSRRATSVASIATLEDALEFVGQIKFIEQPISVLFENRFAFKIHEGHESPLKQAGFQSMHQKVHWQRDVKRLQMFIKNIWSEFQASINQEREAYLEYLCDKHIQDQSAVVDLGYSGTAQQYLSLLTGKKLGGLYVGTNEKIAKLDAAGLTTDGFVIHRASRHTNHSFIRNIPIMEFIFLDQQKSLMCFKKIDGKPEPFFFLPEENFHQQRINLVHHIHKGAMDFVRDWRDNFGNEVSLQDPRIAFETFNQLLNKPTKKDALLFTGHYFENNYANNNNNKSMCLLAEENKFMQGNYREAIKASQWKAAAYVLAGKSLSLKYTLSKYKRMLKQLFLG